MDNARVLIDLAEQILAVDELQRPPPKGFERQAKTAKFCDGDLAHGVDQVRFIIARGVGEALPDAAPRAWTCDNEIHFGKVDRLAVVQIDRELKGEKIP